MEIQYLSIRDAAGEIVFTKIPIRQPGQEGEFVKVRDAYGDIVEIEACMCGPHLHTISDINALQETLDKKPDAYHAVLQPFDWVFDGTLEGKETIPIGGTPELMAYLVKITDLVPTIEEFKAGTATIRPLGTDETMTFAISENVINVIHGGYYFGIVHVDQINYIALVTNNTNAGYLSGSSPIDGKDVSTGVWATVFCLKDDSEKIIFGPKEIYFPSIAKAPAKKLDPALVDAEWMPRREKGAGPLTVSFDGDLSRHPHTWISGFDQIVWIKLSDLIPTNEQINAGKGTYTTIDGSVHEFTDAGRFNGWENEALGSPGLYFAFDAYHEELSPWKFTFQIPDVDGAGTPVKIPEEFLPDYVADLPAEVEMAKDEAYQNKIVRFLFNPTNNTGSYYLQNSFSSTIVTAAELEALGYVRKNDTMDYRMVRGPLIISVGGGPEFLTAVAVKQMDDLAGSPFCVTVINSEGEPIKLYTAEYTLEATE
ncbi:MAG: hypothetical protein IJX94_01365 [Clostridia bacterium]|nr:hypothetical protein [Clostridia bacterium]